MDTKDFYFDLPAERIAQHPSEKRGEDRLLVMDRATGGRMHRFVRDMPDLLDGSNALLVFNNSRVRKARLYGTDVVSGKLTEFLLAKPLPLPSLPQASQSGDGFVCWQVMTKKARSKKDGSRFVFSGGLMATLHGGALPCLEFDAPIDDAWLDQFGHVPLPPYIKRGDIDEDSERYQTVYAAEHGSAAAPTAGLHWTVEMFDELARRGIETAFVTLHVGLGTFLPVRTEKIEDHLMHEEQYSITEETAAKIEAAKREGRTIVAVGTTSLRALESAWQAGHLLRGEHSTSIFIYGDYQFKLADALFTNFHTPESTLLMLVSAFAGRARVMDAYADAIASGYRFFSYGDAMFIR